MAFSLRMGSLYSQAPHKKVSLVHLLKNKNAFSKVIHLLSVIRLRQLKQTHKYFFTRFGKFKKNAGFISLLSSKAPQHAFKLLKKQTDWWCVQLRNSETHEHPPTHTLTHTHHHHPPPAVEKTEKLSYL